MTFYIPFTRYFRPDGRNTQVNFSTERADVYNRAQEFINAGFHFEFEDLTTGEGSWTIGDDDGDYVYVIRPASNLEDRDAKPHVEQKILDTTLDFLQRSSRIARGEDEPSNEEGTEL